MSACCQTCACDPCSCCATNFTNPLAPGYDVARTLARSLIPCVDQIRDLYTCFGTRSETVVLVRTRWSGGEQGVGVEEVISETVLLPIPRVAPGSSYDRNLQSVGIVEQGTLKVDQISARYTQDELQGYGPGGTRIPDDQQFYWEVRVLQGASEQRRRFQVSGTPALDAISLQWSVRLARAQGDRGRAGDPR